MAEKQPEIDEDTMIPTPQVNGAPMWFHSWMVNHHLPMCAKVNTNTKLLWVILAAIIGSAVWSVFG